MMSRLWVATVILLLALVPGAAAEADAWVDRQVAPPGETIHLIFVTDASYDVDVAVGRRIACTVTGPDDFQESPCDHAEGAVTAQVLDSGQTEYVFAYRVPRSPGGYDVLFEVRDTLSVPGTGYAATAKFHVDPEAPRGSDPLDPDAPDTPDTAPDNGAGPGDGANGPGGASGDRGKQGLVVSGSVGTAAIVAALAARRFPL